MFWTMKIGFLGGAPVTYCEAHALEETNQACRIMGLETFATMAEGALIMEALAALAGQSFGLVSSEEGLCDRCNQTPKEEILARAPGGDAA